MRAVMLAAGCGTRLSNGEPDFPPKVLLRFDEKSLLERHIEILRTAGLEELVLVIGYRQEDVRSDIARAGFGSFVRTVVNPDYELGAVVSLAAAASALTDGKDVLFMDADLLYERVLIDRLVASPHENCFLLDRNLDAGDDPVKLCLRDGQIVEFGKKVSGSFDVVGEWPGFLRLSPAMARRTADAVTGFLAAGRHTESYEPAIRDILLDEPPRRFGYEDITGSSWIEIDFPEDLERARSVILPRIGSLPAVGRQVTSPKHRAKQGTLGLVWPPGCEGNSFRGQHAPAGQDIVS
jgi:choline kinase